MQTIVMPTRSEISHAALLEAIKLARVKDGKDKIKFIEILFAPETEQCDKATSFGHRLLEQGFGVKLTVDWGFLGTTRWAIQTENARIVNEGLAV